MIIFKGALVPQNKASVSYLNERGMLWHCLRQIAQNVQLQMIELTPSVNPGHKEEEDKASFVTNMARTR